VEQYSRFAYYNVYLIIDSEFFVLYPPLNNFNLTSYVGKFIGALRSDVCRFLSPLKAQIVRKPLKIILVQEVENLVSSNSLKSKHTPYGACFDHAPRGICSEPLL